MNTAHLHLIINHLPLFGFVFSLLLLSGGLIFKNKSIVNVSLIAFVVTGLLTLPAFFTGVGAEDVLLKVAPESKSFIHYHEESAKLSMILSILLATISLIILFINRKSDIKFLYYLMLVFTLIVIISLVETNYLGGKIRHSEIRNIESIDIQE